MANGVILADLRARPERVLGDRYRLEFELGRDGMSRVFVAGETRLHRPIVVRALPAGLGTPVSRDRFCRTALRHGA